MAAWLPLLMVPELRSKTLTRPFSVSAMYKSCAPTFKASPVDVGRKKSIMNNSKQKDVKGVPLIKIWDVKRRFVSSLMRRRR